MNMASQSAVITARMLLAVLASVPQYAYAQTPQQMEYERQQREYRQQQEQQRQEQQRQQQLMNENARRQQEESRRLNTPMGQTPAPAYQGGTPQMGQRGAQPPAAQFDASAATATAKWVELGSLPAYGGLDIYSDPVTKQRSGDLVRMWEMWDFKTAQVIDGKRVLSVKNHYEYDCKRARRRMLATAGFSGHMGKGSVAGSGNKLGAWASAPTSDYSGELWQVACAKK